jgi:hypothetical protein
VRLKSPFGRDSTVLTLRRGLRERIERPDACLCPTWHRAIVEREAKRDAQREEDDGRDDRSEHPRPRAPFAHRSARDASVGVQGGHGS